MISGAGAVRGVEVPPLRALSFRGMSSSVVFFQIWSVSEFLEVAIRSANSVFSLFLKISNWGLVTGDLWVHLLLRVLSLTLSKVLVFVLWFWGTMVAGS